VALTPDLLLAELALDQLEAMEARCLVWGLVDNALSTDEVTEALRRALAKPEAARALKDGNCQVQNAWDLRGLLVERKMLFEVPVAVDAEKRWRTRMAEGVRLIARLRQLFPKHGTSQWVEAATLVADYRFLRRARRYPRRNLSGAEVHKQLGEAVTSPVLLGALGTWLEQLGKSGGLAQFQVKSAGRILTGLEAGTVTGTLVSAGTGSGKTLAFYLPALSWLAMQHVQDGAAKRVRVLALYPRTELLKDQLSEVYDQCRKFDAWIARQGGRPLRVGVLFGDTPTTLKKAIEMRHWAPHPLGKRVPFFLCPTDGQHGEMLLRREDVAAGVARLVCTKCGAVVNEDSLAFTRDAIKKDPPDIVFTSVEMLNRHLPSSDLRHVFGVGPEAQHAPDLVLLDEVHLYAGSYGAQVAYLLRRWWAASGRRSTFVGLSATITEGKAFFSQLTGLAEGVVEEIKPLEDEIVEEGAEYMLALRGDPVSQTALLSTTIQTLMLNARMLDPRESFDARSMPFFGWRSFAFTDQLDATNRLFKNLLDAEGRYPNGSENFNRHPDGGLARLRSGAWPILGGPRYYAGQDWSIPEAIGHTLSNRLKVGRTTALDSGVSSQTEVVVATSALEVGFDDPAVGMVLQHKAPRNVASFLQRKGRAGRTRHMRPWTIVVLTDYGRDRLAYQAYDQLFDPELPARQLPLGNRYVQKMQAVYALLDELGDWTCRDWPPLSVWRDLSQPNADPNEVPRGWTREAFSAVRRLADEISPPLSEQGWRSLRGQAIGLAPRGSNSDVLYAGANWAAKRLQHTRVVKLLGDVLDNPARAERLTRDLAQRLGLTVDETNLLMWSQPRALMLSAIPTAIRRLASGWRANGEPGKDYQAGHPLPDFIPGSLFDDLSLPEMRIDLAEQSRGLEDQYLPVQQGLGEFAPGKVSRRYDDALWLGVDGPTLARFFASGTTDLAEDADLAGWFELEPQRPIKALEGNEIATFRAFRPLAAHLSRVPKQGDGVPELSDTSNAQLRWVSFLQAPHHGITVDVPQHIGIGQLIKQLKLYTHSEQSHAVARRYAVGSRADLLLRSGAQSERVSVDWQFRSEGQPCGVGFDIDVDALVLVLNLPDNLHAAIDWTDARRGRAARAARYNWEARHNQAFREALPNPFARGWVAQIFQIAALQISVAEDLDLRTAMDRLADGDRQSVLLNVLQTVFQVPDPENGDEGSDKLRKALNTHLQSAEVRRAVRMAANALVEPIDAKWNDWLALTVRATLGAACLEAIQQACPQVDPDGLVVDIEVQSDDGLAPSSPEIWISEVNPGGNGLVESVAELLVTRPDSLYRHIEAALGPRDFEWTNLQLRQMVQWLGGEKLDQDIMQAVAQVRQALSSAEAAKHFAELRALLVGQGQSLFHGYSVALSMRLLRPDSPTDLDHLLARIHQRWDELEATHNVEVDVRVLCALFSVDEELDLAFQTSGQILPRDNRMAWRFGVLMGLLWPQGHALRATALPWANRFSSFALDTERLLLEQWLTKRPEPIDPSTINWAEQVRKQLLTTPGAVVSIPAAQVGVLLPQVVATMAIEPIQFDYLNVFARLMEVKRLSDRIELTFSIPASL
jgi:hypothetical protein